MSYIGREPQIGNFQVCDAISVVNGQAAYTMQVGSVNVLPETANHMLVSLNGILQAPTTSYTVSGSTITFASNLVTGDVIDFIQILGSVLDLGVPSDATVSTAKIVDANVTSAKMFSGFANGITMADQWRVTTSFTGSAAPISSNWERNDTAPSLSYFGSQMTESSGVFTFPSTGIYYVSFTANVKLDGDSRFNYGLIKGTTDGSTLITLTEASTSITQSQSAATLASVSPNLINLTKVISLTPLHVTSVDDEETLISKAIL